MRPVFPVVACVLLSAAMQTAIFPLAGPLHPLAAQMAWIACVPWFYVLATFAPDPQSPLLRSTLWSYGCGILWYLGHCYWIFQTMHQYGNLGAAMAALVLVLFCLYLGLYHAAFGLAATALIRFFRGKLPPALLAVLLAATWTAVELARARITSFPWDLLGYSQTDNAALTHLAPFAGVYAISFLVAFANAGFALALVPFTSAPDAESRAVNARMRATSVVFSAAFGVAALCALAGWTYHAPRPASTEQAIAVQPNLDPSPQSSSVSAPLEHQLADLSTVALLQSGSPRPHLILWPEAPTPYELHDQLFASTLTSLAASSDATVLADSNAVDADPTRSRHSRIYNAAALFTAKGMRTRYDKIHLVPFGEFVPYADLFQFASGLTEQVGTFDRGTRRVPLSDGHHTFGTFICYESIFPEEVRQLVGKGADVLINLSDDGWYGDTSAPFQHSNMARMRAIENRRWLLRDTNTGITEAIDPYGNVRAAAPRHQRLAVALPFAYTSGLTFYTQHGDIFAWLCAAATISALLFGIARQSE